MDNPSPPEAGAAEYNLLDEYTASELILGLVGAVGTDFTPVVEILTTQLTNAKYTTDVLSISKELLEPYYGNSFERDISERSNTEPCSKEYARISTLMDAGNRLRSDACDKDKNVADKIVGLGVASLIQQRREKKDGDTLPFERKAFIVRSFKCPEEIEILRKIYPQSFYVIGVYASVGIRKNYLVSRKSVSRDEADKLIARDASESCEHGQQLVETFHLSDFFVNLSGNDDKLKHSLVRITNLLFGDRFATPTFDEYAMFSAFTASMRSSDLSRQIGAVIADEKKHLILSTGANECPSYSGGHYWTEFDPATGAYKEAGLGKDWKRGKDSNKFSIQEIARDISKKIAGEFASVSEEAVYQLLCKSKIDDLTEYGRVVHAEMDALLSCARSSTSTAGMTLYGMTFPCHNCAKHIISAGIIRVVFIEPYQKSKAEEFHNESIVLGTMDDKEVEQEHDGGKKVLFEPFIGVGPRRFLDLFSMKHGAGGKIKRKNKDGTIINWEFGGACNLRVQMLPYSYLDLESVASNLFETTTKTREQA